VDVLNIVDFCVVDNKIFLGGHKPGKRGKPGMLRDFSKQGKLREFSGNSVQPQRKIVTNKVFLVRHSNICVKHGQNVVVTCYIAGVDVE